MGCCNRPPKANNEGSGESGDPTTKPQNSRISRPGKFANFSKKRFDQEYEEIKVIGEGSFGSVKLVKHISTGLERAAKEIVITRDANFGEIFDEVEIMRQIDHPHIIKVLEIFSLDTRIIIVLELCTGGELFNKIVSERSFSENKAAKYMLEIVSALNYLHSIGIVHRDLKPENLLLENKYYYASVKLADFGTATYIQEGQKLTQRIGTSYYMAPEVLRGSYDQKCDVWSMGVILYVMLCGSPPFNGENNRAVYKNILQAKLEFRQKAWSIVSKEAKDLIAKMLQKDPDKRLSFHNVLEHPWIKKRAHNQVPDKPIAEDSLNKLNNFNVRNKMMNASLAFISSQLLKQEELRELKHLFKQMDTNRDGKLSMSEVEKGMAKYGMSKGRNIHELMVKCDIDGDGFVNYNEFIIAATDWSEKLSEQKLYEAFKVYDVNEDGKISIEEVKNVLMEEGEPENDFLHMMRELDCDGDGEISFEEFSKYMKNNLETNEPDPNRI